MRIVARHLENLKRRADGDELYALIASGLRKFGRQGPIGDDCCVYLHAQLDAYARDPLTLPALRIKARLLQQHFAAFLPETETPAAPAAEYLTDTAFAGKPGPGAGAHAGGSGPAAPDGPALEGVLERAPDKGHKAESGVPHEALLRSEQDAWRAIYDTVKDFSKLKQLWSSSLDELARERDALEQRLNETNEYLKSIEAEKTRLCAELETRRQGNARKNVVRLPVVKASGKSAGRPAILPKRETFLRYLDSEIKRVKRSGSPLALALLGVDNLDSAHGRHGLDAEEAVLRCYAREVLSSFRAYDVVARFGQNEFAVLLPDTQKDGALRALEKAQKRAGATYYNHNGREFALPGFRGALTVYSTGEEPGALLRRAHQALHAARQKNEHAVVVA
jgi:diguanylate cyclase (GGDEF)-like protein